jgi:hypothetical protein
MATDLEDLGLQRPEVSHPVVVRVIYQYVLWPDHLDAANAEQAAARFDDDPEWYESLPRAARGAGDLGCVEAYHEVESATEHPWLVQSAERAVYEQTGPVLPDGQFYSDRSRAAWDEHYAVLRAKQVRRRPVTEAHPPAEASA